MNCLICWNKLSESPDVKPTNSGDAKRIKLGPSHNESVSTPCGHAFHRTCIEEWLQNNGTCPACRKEIRTTSLRPLALSGDGDNAEHSCSNEECEEADERLAILRNNYQELEDRYNLERERADFNEAMFRSMEGQSNNVTGGNSTNSNETAQSASENISGSEIENSTTAASLEQSSDNTGDATVNLVNPTSDVDITRESYVERNNNEKKELEGCSCNEPGCQEIHRRHAILKNQYDELRQKLQQETERVDLYDGLIQSISESSNNGTDRGSQSAGQGGATSQQNQNASNFWDFGTDFPFGDNDYYDPSAFWNGSASNVVIQSDRSGNSVSIGEGGSIITSGSSNIITMGNPGGNGSGIIIDNNSTGNSNVWVNGRLISGSNGNSGSNIVMNTSGGNSSVWVNGTLISGSNDSSGNNWNFFSNNNDDDESTDADSDDDDSSNENWSFRW
ncbi:E3 ubiquitin-protein ligase HRD1 [Orchesella cincta]|uniref:E3 ubiquitin-protein ligase HRD1 n=1 Tax=Orchesella cincta TaxID=48709 RepID=A0A1D2N2C1_ORCCI|nr:E3 ubiquitin-protein ligase HRD1 [Orchesella cincta]